MIVEEEILIGNKLIWLSIEFVIGKKKQKEKLKSTFLIRQLVQLVKMSSAISLWACNFSPVDEGLKMHYKPHTRASSFSVRASSAYDSTGR